ncbi:hypothetical protein [Sinosporangium siamense]|uniref:Uncharacterized protein n=1 Tax=Sinosporangium siamense TaxID=1367973 RepID=A0A919RMC0_9ACTN|nr:hypothetical protein [Sinosporangium siamense]GII96388.1 hypothetical protein Ssi02_66190 [Sinosporangium siamense]
MIDPDTVEQHHTLLTAAARLNDLRIREALASAGEEDEPGTPSLTREEALELLALGEVLARKAGYGRQLTVRSARAAGASWTQIGTALGTSKQAAWEAHNRWIDDQAHHDARHGHYGWDPSDIAAARALAGENDT